MSLSLKIVHIGKGTTPDEINHIIGLRSYGHSVYVPGNSTHEQLIRRIMDAGMVFELGMVYFYSVYALHHRLHWVVKWHCDGSALPVFMPPPCENDPAEIETQYKALGVPKPEFVPVPCHSDGAGPCDECADTEDCNRDGKAAG